MKVIYMTRYVGWYDSNDWGLSLCKEATDFFFSLPVQTRRIRITLSTTAFEGGRQFYLMGKWEVWSGKKIEILPSVYLFLQDIFRNKIFYIAIEAME